MNFPQWTQEFPCAITVCDREGVILYMNEKSCATFEKYGGAELIGQNLAGCHPEPARSKLFTLLKEQKTNAYTIEKNGVKKMIYQSPWYENGEFMGLVEFSLILPMDMPHFIRS